MLPHSHSRSRLPLALALFLFHLLPPLPLLRVLLEFAVLIVRLPGRHNQWSLRWQLLPTMLFPIVARSRQHLQLLVRGDDPTAQLGEILVL